MPAPESSRANLEYGRAIGRIRQLRSPSQSQRLKALIAFAWLLSESRPSQHALARQFRVSQPYAWKLIRKVEQLGVKAAIGAEAYEHFRELRDQQRLAYNERLTAEWQRATASASRISSSANRVDTPSQSTHASQPAQPPATAATSAIPSHILARMELLGSSSRSAPPGTAAQRPAVEALATPPQRAADVAVDPSLEPAGISSRWDDPAYSYEWVEIEPDNELPLKVKARRTNTGLVFPPGIRGRIVRYLNEAEIVAIEAAPLGKKIESPVKQRTSPPYEPSRKQTDDLLLWWAKGGGQ